jgi:hypothetical protein
MGIGGGGGVEATAWCTGIWQREPSFIIQTRSQTMAYTVYPPTSSPIRRSVAFSLPVEIAANDQLGSSAVVMSATLAESQMGSA